MTAVPIKGFELRSSLTAAGEIRLALEEVVIPAPGPGEVLVRVEAAPVNPTDLLLLVGPVGAASFESSSENGSPTLTAPVPPEHLSMLKSRIGQGLTAGLEGAGTVIAAGVDAQSLVGRKVATWAGRMFAQYRTISVAECAVLPDDVKAAEAASNWTNPMTALALVETIRRQGHRAFVQTAAASNLGQMLNRIAKADGLSVVNIVRSEAQAALLHKLDAAEILDSTSGSFVDHLAEAIDRTGARVAFDFIGGGRMASTILEAMEASLRRNGEAHPLYGSPLYKHVYICGGLDHSPIELNRRPFGQAWGISGFYVGNALDELGAETTQLLRARVIRELGTTFASPYAATIGMSQLLDREVLTKALSKSTGGKYLLDPRY